MRAAFYTLGCKVNQNETGALIRLFEQNGYTIAAEGEQADVYVVNSCTVTAGGDKKSRQWLRRAKRENPAAVTVLTGCYPQAFPEEAARDAEADVVTGSANRHSILACIQRCLESGERVVEITPHQRGEAFEELPLENFEGHTRAFIKIEDGCDRQCAYCVIPRARGRVRSRDEESILAEMRALADAGYAECVLSGINLSSYGKDTGATLAGLVEKAAQIPGLARIRLGSLEPDLMTDQDIARLAAVDKLCPQFHLSLQSGCDATLRRMRRLYNTEQYRQVARKLRQAFGGDCSLTTDVIVGFAGETEEEFAQSLAFVEEMEFLKVHVFPYSRREGTPGWSMPDQVDEQTKADRVKRMQTAADAVRARLCAAMEGQTETVLLEKAVSGNVFTGYTRLYAPVAVTAPGCRPGQIVQVQLGAFDGRRCAARLV